MLCSWLVVLEEIGKRQQLMGKYQLVFLRKQGLRIQKWPQRQHRRRVVSPLIRQLAALQPRLGTLIGGTWYRTRRSRQFTTNRWMWIFGVRRKRATYDKCRSDA